MKKRHLFHLLLAPLLTIIPMDAWALQSHSAPEGLYVHQMAHILFTGALIYLYWHTRRTPELKGRGWKYLQIFCIVFACWNLLAFIGHEALKSLTELDFLHKNTWREHLAGPITGLKFAYFITKMDHLLYVPALAALVMGLRVFYLDAIEEGKK